MRHRWLVVATVAPLSWAGDVLLPDGKTAKPLTSEQITAMHGRFDKDNDGRASLDEVMQFWSHTRHSMASNAASDLMTQMDLDKDGKISLDDILGDEVFSKMDPESKVVQDHMFTEGKKFMAADKNNDHALDVSEVSGFFFPDTHDGVQEAMASRLVELNDVNEDGELSEAEFVDEKRGRTKHDFKDLDVDRSGRLSRVELKSWESGKHHTMKAVKKLIEVTDQDGDSHMSKSEFEEAREAVATLDAHKHLTSWVRHHEL
eukprot:TRINITY_DN64597_c0_g1_i1.p1 TRINITY_DN64597_c0_g1~~TRINITY_DN64597_c0_g1_i1.p1  ORF type:complete len:260 (+),score=45.65 TRINITY_DN64597_c0_g1_i1:68-847(+)